MRRWINGALGISVPAIALAALAQTAVLGGGGDYEVVELATPENTSHWYWAYANDINDSGRIIGAREYFDAQRQDGAPYYRVRALHWGRWNADPEELEALDGYSNTWAASINNRGETCGWSSMLYWQNYQAVVWDKDGNVENRHPDFGDATLTDSQMWDINQYGDCVGVVTARYGWGRAFIAFANGDEELLELDTEEYVQSWPYEVSKDGVVVGFVRLDAGGGYGSPTRAAYWDELGDFHDMHDMLEEELEETLYASKAWNVNDQGEIGGVVVVDSGITDVRAFVWSEDEGFVFVDSDDEDLSAIVSGAGRRMTGVIGGTAEGFGSGTAAVWTRGRSGGQVVWRLDTLETLDGYTGMQAVSGNTSGRLVGAAEDADGNWTAWYAEK